MAIETETNNFSETLCDMPCTSSALCKKKVNSLRCFHKKRSFNQTQKTEATKIVRFLPRIPFKFVFDFTWLQLMRKQFIYLIFSAFPTLRTQYSILQIPMIPFYCIVSVIPSSKYRNYDFIWLFYANVKFFFR